MACVVHAQDSAVSVRGAVAPQSLTINGVRERDATPYVVWRSCILPLSKGGVRGVLVAVHWWVDGLEVAYVHTHRRQQILPMQHGSALQLSARVHGWAQTYKARVHRTHHVWHTGVLTVVGLHHGSWTLC